MKIDCVIVCHNYADFLSYTLPLNMHYLDHVVVVTHPDDKATRGVCSKYSVNCVTTTEMHDHGDAFNKGRCINVGLGHMAGGDWILHLDADIVLPHNFRDLLKRAQLEKNKIYGADRLNVYGYDHWDKHKHKIAPHFSHRYFIEAIKEFPLGARIIHQQFGYCPIGYFQLWHSSEGKKYPYNQGNAEHDDLLHAVQWSRKNRILLPEVLCYHLESGTGPVEMGLNWRGRKSPPFGPEHKHHKHRYCPDDD